MAQSESSGSSTAIVAIVAIVLLLMIGFFFVRGVGGPRGGTGVGSGSEGVKGSIEFKVPTPNPPAGP